MSEQKKEHISLQAAMREGPATAGTLPPWVFGTAIIIVFAAGAVLMLTRSARLESSLYASMNDCDAHVIAFPPDKGVDGLSDYFAVIQFKNERAGVARLLSLCDTDPEMARRLFRKAFKQGNTSAKLVALHCAFFLTQAPRGEKARGWLEDEDFAAMAALLNAAVPDTREAAQRAAADLRKAAQHVISDLTRLINVAAEEKYKTLPNNLPPVVGEAPAHKISTRQEKIGEQTVLNIRWSDPDLAYAWWKLNAQAGHWDMTSQRFVIP